MPSKERTADFFQIIDTPGPGQYTSRKMSRNTSTHRFNSAKRQQLWADSTEKSTEPGPG